MKKLCFNCQWCNNWCPTNPKYAECTRPVDNVINGRLIDTECLWERRDDDECDVCGPEGKYYQEYPNLSLIETILAVIKRIFK